MGTASRQNSPRFHIPVVIAALAAVVLIGASAEWGGATTPATAPPSDLTAEAAIAQIEGEDGVLRFDVAENGARFAWSGEPELVDGLPATDTPYVTQGYIYPAGTLTESNGVNADGSPEFPDKVLGQWSCYGWRLRRRLRWIGALAVDPHLQLRRGARRGDDRHRGLQHRRPRRRAGASDHRRHRPLRGRRVGCRWRPTSASTRATASTSATR